MNPYPTAPPLKIMPATIITSGPYWMEMFDAFRQTILKDGYFWIGFVVTFKACTEMTENMALDWEVLDYTWCAH